MGFRWWGKGCWLPAKSKLRPNLAVLVGNGLSVAFNPELALDAITAEVMRRLGADAGDDGDVVAAMQEIASRAVGEGQSTAENFEKLVGAFGYESRTLDYLHRLATLESPSNQELRDSIANVRDFATRVSDRGISHVLEVILERSRATGERAERLEALIRAMLHDFRGTVTVANLNYDTLLLATLMSKCDGEFADMADGGCTERIEVAPGRFTDVPTLRTKLNFPASRRIHLVPLHGSLTYWTDGTGHWKLRVEEIRKLRMFASVRDGQSALRPAVVLATSRDKASHVEEAPFALAYSACSRSLEVSNHWLIIGYSFRDEPVNATLAEAFGERNPKPRVHVVTYGDSPSEHTVMRALGWNIEDGSPDEWLTIDRDGALGAHNRDAWLHEWRP